MNIHEKGLSFAIGPVKPETPPEVDVQAEDIESVEDEAALQRACQYTHDNLVLKYGSLPENHPAQQDINKIFERLGPEAGNFVKRIVVLPNMPEINAMVLPDGTVFVSPTLMQFCDTEEALCGILAHEVVHLKEEDSRKKQRPQKEEAPVDRIESFKEIIKPSLRTISLDRLMESRADIEAVILFLDKAGINPLGYKHFLKKMDLRETRGYGYRPSSSHGTSIDRALAIGLISYFHDLTSLSSELTALDASQKQSWQSSASSEAISRSHLFHPVRFEKNPADAHGKRLAVIDQLSSTDRHLALSELFDYWSSGLFQEEQARQEQIYQKLAARVDVDIQTVAGADTEDVALMKFLHYQMDLGIEASGKEKQTIGEEDCIALRDIFDQISTVADMARVRKMIPRLAELEPPYAIGHPLRMMVLVADIYFGREMFGPLIKNQYDFTSWFSDVTAWADCLSQFSRQRGCVAVSKQEVQKTAFIQLSERAGRNPDFKEQAADFVQANGLELEHDTAQQRKERAQVALQKEIAEDPEFSKIIVDFMHNFPGIESGQDTLRALPLDIFEKWWKTMDAYITKKISNRSVAEIGVLLSAIFDQISFQLAPLLKDMPFIEDHGKDNPSGYEEEKETFDRVVHRTMLASYNAVVFSHPAFAQLSRWQKMTAVSIANQAWIINKYEETAMSDAIFDVTKHTKAWYQLGKKTSQEQIVWYYSTLQEDRFGLLSSTEVMIECTDLIAYYVDIISFQLSSAPVVSWPNTLLRLEQDGIPVRKAFKTMSERLGHLVAAAAEHLSTIDDEGQEPGVLELIVDWVNDPYLKIVMQQRILAIKWQHQAGFDGHFALAFGEQNDVGSLESKDRLVEEDMETEAQVAEVRKRIRSITDDVFASGNEQIGWAVVAEQIGLGKNPVATLDTLLSTRESELAIKTAIFRQVEIDVSERYEELGSSSKEALSMMVACLQNGQRALNSAFSLDGAAKLYLVKKLLVDSRAIQQPSERRNILSALLERTVKNKKGQEGLATLLTDTANAAADVKDWELLFYSLSPTLADNLLVPPAERVSWVKVAESQHVLDLNRIKGLDRIGSLPKTANNSPWSFQKQYLAVSEDKLRQWLQTKEGLSETSHESYSPLELIVDIAQRTGSFGVRFLQLMPQFLAVPADYERSFNRLYDKVRGQSKLTAISVMEREWPDMWQYIERVGQRLGGGSLMTVYEVTMKTGEKRAIRVRNPNIVYHLEMTRDFIKAVVAEMKKRRQLTPEAAAQLETVIGFVDEWIRRDMDFEGFLEADAKFKETNENYTRQGLNRKIHVPKSEGPTSNYFQVEELIEGGHNLTEWNELVAEGCDIKEVIALIVSNAMHQLEAGQLHGDVHIGNYRVMPDGNVAILDRTFYLDLDGDEKSIISSLLTGNIELAKIFSYISKLLPAEKVSNMPQVIRSLTTLGGQFAGGDFVGVNRSLVEMRQAGVQVPLKITLLLRNINNLRLLSEKAGFTSLQEANTYQLAA